jgi:hypothetical protein
MTEDTPETLTIGPLTLRRTDEDVWSLVTDVPITNDLWNALADHVRRNEELEYDLNCAVDAREDFKWRLHEMTHVVPEEWCEHCTVPAFVNEETGDTFGPYHRKMMLEEEVAQLRSRNEELEAVVEAAKAWRHCYSSGVEGDEWAEQQNDADAGLLIALHALEALDG